MTEFKEVSESLRDNPGSDRRSLYDALAAGKTVFVPLNGEASWYVANRIRSSLTARGYRCHVRTTVVDHEKGIVAWAEPKDGAA